MAVPSANVPLTGLARKLVADKLLDQKVAQEAWVEASREKIPFVTHVVAKGLIKGHVVAHIAADEFGVPLVDLNTVEIDPDVTRLVQEKLIRDNHALPLYKRGTRLYVAVSDPTNLQALDEMKFASGAQAEPVIVEDDKLVRIIDKALEAVDTSMNMGEGDELENLEGEKALEWCLLLDRIDPAHCSDLDNVLGLVD